MSRRAAERLLIAQALHEPVPFASRAKPKQPALPKAFVGIDFGEDVSTAVVMRRLDYGKLELASVFQTRVLGEFPAAEPPEDKPPALWDPETLARVREKWTSTYPAVQLTKAALDRSLQNMRRASGMKPSPMLMPPSGFGPTGRRVSALAGGFPLGVISGATIKQIIMDDPLLSALAEPKAPDPAELAFRNELRAMRGEPPAISVDVKLDIKWDSASAMSEDEWHGR
jgi:hypothetical protein